MLQTFRATNGDGEYADKCRVLEQRTEELRQELSNVTAAVKAQQSDI